jgi:pantoate--beta-alanine ligase
MKVFRTVAALREARRDWPELGLVPTMGFLHAGHLSLVARAREECGAAAASIFVNPTQFGPNEDLARYPRDLERDLDLLERAGTAFVFVPEVAEIYPPGFSCRIEMGEIGEVLEGAARPGHFAGVATVVTKLLNIVQPDRAYFGQKDAQQSVVIRRLVRDLDLPVEIVIGATVREADGLALSSRNVYLTPPQRQAAPILYRALRAAERAYAHGHRDAGALRALVRDMIADARDIALQYVSVADPETLQELEGEIGSALLSLAARLGQTRLIDNIVLDPRSLQGAGAARAGSVRDTVGV